VIYADLKKKKPLMVVEFKNQIMSPLATNQLLTYMKRIGAPYGVLTDGVQNQYYRIFEKEMIQIPRLMLSFFVRKPRSVEKILKNITQSTLVEEVSLKEKVRDFDYALQSIYEHIISNEKVSFQVALQEMQKLILCKLEDELTPKQQGFLLFESEIGTIENIETQETIRSRLNALFKKVKLEVIIGGEMTHPGYLRSEKGYIADEALDEMYLLAAKLGIMDFVVPGNKIDRIKHYKQLLQPICGENLVFYSPGLIAQGGKVTEAARAAGESWHAIVGRAIYDADNITDAAEEIARGVLI
jgi:hypothetical protein